MNKNKILEKLQNEWEDVRGQMNDISIDFCGDFSNYLDGYAYLCDLFTEYADNRVDIYNSDLIEWAQENYNYIDDAIEEFGAPEPFDFWACIRQGQYYEYNEELNSDTDNIIKGLALLYLIDELQAIDAIERTEQEFEELFDELNNIDSNDREDEIKDICDEFLKNENE